jgi:hypothetical protein
MVLITIATLVALILVVLIMWLDRHAARNTFSRECPHCRELMRGEASVCPHCQRESEAWQQDGGFWWRQSEAGWEYLDSGAWPGRWRRSAATREP